jgi:hypothetical protein
MYIRRLDAELRFSFDIERNVNSDQARLKLSAELTGREFLTESEVGGVNWKSSI